MILDILNALLTDLPNFLPTAISLENAAYPDGNLLVNPVTYQKWVRADILERPADALPAVQVAIYNRTTKQEGQQDFSWLRWPFGIQVALCHEDEGLLGDLAAKWSDVLDYYIQERGNLILPGLHTPEAPMLALTTSAQRISDGRFVCLVQASNAFERAR